MESHPPKEKTCNYYFIQEVDSISTELIEVQKNAVTFSKWKEMQKCLNGARCSVNFMPRVYKISKNI